MSGCRSVTVLAWCSTLPELSLVWLISSAVTSTESQAYTMDPDWKWNSVIEIFLLSSTIFLASFLYICCFNPLYNCKVGWKDHENVIITKLLSQSHTPLTLHYHSAWNNLMTFSLHIIPLYKMDKTFANSQEVFGRGRCIWWCHGWTQYATLARSWSGWQTTPQKRWLVLLVNLDSQIGNSFKMNCVIYETHVLFS